MILGICNPLWYRHDCTCAGGIRAPDCALAFAPVSFIESDVLVFAPGDRFRRDAALRSLSSTSQTSESEVTDGISLAFRTLVTDCVLLRVTSFRGETVLEVANGELRYSSRLGGIHGGNSGSAINTTSSGAAVSDGQWHSASLIVSSGGGLQMKLDGDRVGDELEASATHDFLGTDVDSFTLGHQGDVKGK